MTCVFFLKGPLSQWSPSPFIDKDGIQYKNAEQYMMYQKAKLFGDDLSARHILETDSPKESKVLGRAAANFNSSIWDKSKVKIVYNGNFLKFNQNPEHAKILLQDYGEKVLFVETNPKDRIWGIGYSEEDAKVTDSSLWGQNLLGKILTMVRNCLKKGEENAYYNE